MLILGKVQGLGFGGFGDLYLYLVEVFLGLPYRNTYYNERLPHILT